MRDNASRRGAVDPGTLLMILAFVVIGVFMWWLNGEAAAERALEIVEDTTTVDATAGFSDVALSALEGDPDTYLGTDVRLSGFGVASLLGTQGFWLGTRSGNPFLVSMSDALMAEGLAVAPGDTINVAGTFLTMNDSILTAWETATTINETDKIVAEFAIHFMEASAVTVTFSAGGGEEGEEGGEGTDGN